MGVPKISSFLKFFCFDLHGIVCERLATYLPMSKGGHYGNGPRYRKYALQQVLKTAKILTIMFAFFAYGWRCRADFTVKHYTQAD